MRRLIAARKGKAMIPPLPEGFPLDCCGAHKRFNGLCAKCRYIRALEAWALAALRGGAPDPAPAAPKEKR